MIYIENLRVTYNQIPALSNINLEIKGPSITGIIGPNGAGKSTLIKAILNIIPSTGIAKIDNKISKENLDNVAYVEQKINIDYNFPIKVRECVSLGLYSKIGIFKKLKKSDWQKVDEALKLVGLENRINNFPSQISGGEQQRVAIARAIAKNPKILLCDEPTGALDYKTGKNILKILKEYCKNEKKTVIVITHNSSIAQTADKVIEIYDAKVKNVFVNQLPKNIDEIEW